MSLSAAELSDINTVAAQTGNDAPLDALLLRLHTETACRRAAALVLTEDDIDADWCLLQLREKGDVTRWQPASPTLVTGLLDHREHRGAGAPTAALLRYGRWRPADHPTLRPSLASHRRAPVLGRQTERLRPLAYLHAEITDIATAVSALTGGPHPSSPLPVDLGLGLSAFTVCSRSPGKRHCPGLPAGGQSHTVPSDADFANTV